MNLGTKFVIRRVGKHSGKSGQRSGEALCPAFCWPAKVGYTGSLVLHLVHVSYVYILTLTGTLESISHKAQAYASIACVKTQMF